MIKSNHIRLIVIVLCIGNILYGQNSDLMLLVKSGKDSTNIASSHTHLSDSTIYYSPHIKELKSAMSINKTHLDNEHTGPLKIISHSGYIAAINTKYNLPAWVSHSVTKYNLEHPDPQVKRESSSYPSDPNYPILKSNAYQSSGYDHGHLAPARDFKHSKIQFAECFYMTNMSPQHGCLNQKGWCVLEDYCRIWTKENSDAISYIVSGSLLTKHVSTFIDSLCMKSGVKVFVPHYFFKAICIYNKTNKTVRSIAFVVPNEALSVTNLERYSISIDELEELTNLNLFSDLPDDIESLSESTISAFNFSYNKKEFDCIDKDCDKMYIKRVKPETRKVLNCN